MQGSARKGTGAAAAAAPAQETSVGVA
jgi:hypothetical protein